MIGAKMVLARPPANVRIVSARTRRGPYQRVRAANAGGYRVALIATPASSHAATNHPKLGAVAIAVTAPTATTEPPVINPRGPRRSNQRPTPMPSRLTPPDRPRTPRSAPASPSRCPD